MDPIRPEVPKSIQDCQTAGIRVIMITGDSKGTAISIAKETGILNRNDPIQDSVFTGSEFEQMSKTDK